MKILVFEVQNHEKRALGVNLGANGPKTRLPNDRHLILVILRVILELQSELKSVQNRCQDAPRCRGRFL